MLQHLPSWHLEVNLKHALDNSVGGTVKFRGGLRDIGCCSPVHRAPQLLEGVVLARMGCAHLFHDAHGSAGISSGLASEHLPGLYGSLGIAISQNESCRKLYIVPQSNQASTCMGSGKAASTLSSHLMSMNIGSSNACRCLMCFPDLLVWVNTFLL